MSKPLFTWFVCLNLAFLLVLLAGCATPGGVVVGSAMVPIGAPAAPKVAPSSGTSLEWSANRLHVTAAAPIDPEIADESLGLARASARLAARDQARAELRQKISELPADKTRKLEDIFQSSPDFAAAIDAEIAKAIERWQLNADATEGRLDVEMTLTDLAENAIRAGAGVSAKDASADAERIRLRAEGDAQRAAFAQARQELRASILKLNMGGGVLMDDMLGAYPELGAEFEKTVSGARTTFSDRVGGDRWKVVLQTDATPFATRVLEVHRKLKRRISQ